MFSRDGSHDLHLHEAVERAQKADININFDKCTVASKSYTSFGNIYILQGVMSDPKKVQAIKQILASSTRQELHSFLGMVNYLSQFVPSISELTKLSENSSKGTFFFIEQDPMRIYFKS